MSRPKVDPLKYVRESYQVPAYLGMRVDVYGKEGTIEGGDGAYIMVRIDGDKFSRPYHPTDGVTYKVEGVRP